MGKWRLGEKGERERERGKVGIGARAGKKNIEGGKIV